MLSSSGARRLGLYPSRAYKSQPDLPSPPFLVDISTSHATFARMIVSTLSPLAQWAGIVLPTLYTGIAAQDSVSTINATKMKTPEKLLAKQWLEVYRQGPYWVLPVVLSAIFSNGLLAYIQHASGLTLRRNLYIAGAFLMWCIPLTTILVFEPGINGACKVKAERLLADEGVRMGDEKSSMLPLPSKHSATGAMRAWAERTDMKDLVAGWARRNMVRCVVAMVSAGVSGYATLML